MKSLTIIKIGGNVVEDPGMLSQFLDEFARISTPKILVHGGGKRATAVSESLGVKPEMKDGRRLTDAATLEVVTMVYGGLINKNIVAALQARDVNALGLTGADLNIVPAHKRVHPTIDYGYVGDFEVVDIDAERIAWLLNEGITPVFCALTHDGKGSLLNTNADTMATGLAIRMSSGFEVELNYCFEKKGVLLDLDHEEDYIRSLSWSYYQQLKADGTIADGMIPKLDNAFNAFKAGVQSIRIRHARQIDVPQGTQLAG